MVKAQRLVDSLSEKLADATGHQQLADLGADLATAQADLDEFEARWLELSELTEPNA